MVKVRYIIEQDVGEEDHTGTYVENWQPVRSPHDRVNVKSVDGIRIFYDAGKANKYMNRIRKPRQRVRVKRIEIG